MRTYILVIAGWLIGVAISFTLGGVKWQGVRSIVINVVVLAGILLLIRISGYIANKYLGRSA